MGRVLPSLTLEPDSGGVPRTVLPHSFQRWSPEPRTSRCVEESSCCMSASCRLRPLFRFTSPVRLPSLTCCALSSSLFPLGPLGWGSPCLPLRHTVTSVTLSPPSHPANSCLPESAPLSFHCLVRQGQALAQCCSASPFVTPIAFHLPDDPLWAIAATRKSSSSFASLLKTACPSLLLGRDLFLPGILSLRIFWGLTLSWTRVCLILTFSPPAYL